jgi:hypothetical protein
MEECEYSASTKLQFDYFCAPLWTCFVSPFANRVNRSLYEHRIPPKHKR